MLPKMATDLAQLRKEGIGAKKIKTMVATLQIFPTPFKGIYYAPTDGEHGAWLIDKPILALSQAIGIYLGTGDFYYSCITAEEFHGISWHRSGEAHVVNTVRSGRIDLVARIGRNEKKKTWRARQVARILECYGRKIIFHKAKTIEGAKVKRTIYGDYALPSQIKKDRKRFRERQ